MLLNVPIGDVVLFDTLVNQVARITSLHNNSSSTLRWPGKSQNSQNVMETIQSEDNKSNVYEYEVYNAQTHLNFEMQYWFCTHKSWKEHISNQEATGWQQRLT